MVIIFLTNQYPITNLYFNQKADILKLAKTEC